AGGGEYCGRHSGYARLRHPLMHERTFWLDDAGALVIHDVLESHGPHRLRWHFHFAPGVQIDRDHGSGHISIAPFRTGSAGLVLIAAAGLESHVIPAWYSPSYGVRVQCTAVEFSSDQLMTGRH